MHNADDSVNLELERLRKQLEAAHKKITTLEARANQDALLGVLNRRGLDEELQRAISFCGRYEMVASLIYCDLDDFKKVNDSYGHDAGDLALRHLMAVVESNLRATDRIGRVGGDEFVFLLWNATQEIAQNKADSLNALLRRRPLELNARTYHLSISCGVTELRADDTPEVALIRADQAMYFAKKRRKLDGLIKR